jgi:hypothetical protein
LHALRKVMASRDESEDKFDWSKTWVAEMFMSHDEIDRRSGKTPDEKRRNEIKAGVITASIGVGLMILLFVLMEGIIAGGQVPPEAVPILSRLWVVGVIPILVGAALIFNGMIVSKKGELEPAEPSEIENPELNVRATPEYLSPADTNELFPAGLSVTDETTKHLKEPMPRS